MGVLGVVVQNAATSVNTFLLSRDNFGLKKAHRLSEIFAAEIATLKSNVDAMPKAVLGALAKGRMVVFNTVRLQYMLMNDTYLVVFNEMSEKPFTLHSTFVKCQRVLASACKGGEVNIQELWRQYGEVYLALERVLHGEDLKVLPPFNITQAQVVSSAKAYVENEKKTFSRVVGHTWDEVRVVHMAEADRRLRVEKLEVGLEDVLAAAEEAVVEDELFEFEDLKSVPTTSYAAHKMQLGGGHLALTGGNSAQLMLEGAARKESDDYEVVHTAGAAELLALPSVPNEGVFGSSAPTGDGDVIVTPAVTVDTVGDTDTMVMPGAGSGEVEAIVEPVVEETSAPIILGGPPEAVSAQSEPGAEVHDTPIILAPPQPEQSPQPGPQSPVEEVAPIILGPPPEESPPKPRPDDGLFSNLAAAAGAPVYIPPEPEPTPESPQKPPSNIPLGQMVGDSSAAKEGSPLSVPSFGSSAPMFEADATPVQVPVPELKDMYSLNVGGSQGPTESDLGPGAGGYTGRGRVVETANILFEGNMLSKYALMGELRVAETESRSKFLIRCEDESAVEAVKVNPQAAKKNENKPGEYRCLVPEGVGRDDSTVVLRYKLSPEHQPIPIRVMVAWQFKANLTSIIVQYAINPSLEVPVTNLQILVTVQNGVVPRDTKPEGTWDDSQQRFLWTVDSVEPKSGSSKLAGRFETTCPNSQDAVATPVLVKFKMMGQTMSGIVYQVLEPPGRPVPMDIKCGAGEYKVFADDDHIQRK